MNNTSSRKSAAEVASVGMTTMLCYIPATMNGSTKQRQASELPYANVSCSTNSSSFCCLLNNVHCIAGNLARFAAPGKILQQPEHSSAGQQQQQCLLTAAGCGLTSRSRLHAATWREEEGGVPSDVISTISNCCKPSALCHLFTARPGYTAALCDFFASPRHFLTSASSFNCQG